MTHMKKNLGMKKIKEVKQTTLGLERINKEKRRRGEDLLPDSEAVKPGKDTVVETDEELAGAEYSTSGEVLAGALPASVDNSTLAAFPPIGAQKWNNCVAWAMGYYQSS